MKIAAVGPVQGLELLHSQCQFGLDTLSWVRLRPRPHREANVGLRPPYSTDSVAVLLTSVPGGKGHRRRRPRRFQSSLACLSRARQLPTRKATPP